MRQCENIEAMVMPNRALNDPLKARYVVGIKWRGIDQWGLKGEGETVDEAVCAAVTAFYNFMLGQIGPQPQSPEATASPSLPPASAAPADDRATDA